MWTQAYRRWMLLQRRLDLIPNLVASVKGYVGEESTVLTDDRECARGRAGGGGQPAGSIRPTTQLSVAMLPLFRLQEAYPNLKGNDQFMRLEDELAGTENRIAVERQRYNETLEDYNVYVKQFPNNIWAGMAGYHYRRWSTSGAMRRTRFAEGGLLEVGLRTNEERPSRGRRPFCA